MTAPCLRVRSATHRTAHLTVPGSLTALCGACPRDGAWSEADGFPDCRKCATAARVAAEVAAWDAPPPRPGILAMVSRGGGGLRAPAGECAACGKVRMLRQRSLCRTCARTATLDGTLEGYGWTREERLTEYGGYRAGGLNIRQASARLGVDRRTGDRYEAELAAAGKAPWRAGVPYVRQAQRELRRAS